jgi:glycosyltransferase involved in cell wall biosynthesis
VVARRAVGCRQPAGCRAPEATIVIVTKDRRQSLRRALTSALQQAGDIEVMVVDDGSTDGTSTMVQECFPDVRLERFATAAGLVVRRNFAVRSARAPVVMSIDDDAIFSSFDTVVRTLAEFDESRVAVVAVPYVDVRREAVVRQRAPSETGCWVAPTFRGTAFAVRRDAFLASSGFREAIFHQGEEPDLALRLLDAGHVVRLGRAPPIHHFESPDRSLRRMDVYGRRNEILLSFTYLPMPWNVAFAAGYALKGLLLGLRLRRPVPMLVGIMLGARDAWRLRRQRRPVSRGTAALDRRLRRAGTLELRDIVAALPRVRSDAVTPVGGQSRSEPCDRG